MQEKIAGIGIFGGVVGTVANVYMASRPNDPKDGGGPKGPGMNSKMDLFPRRSDAFKEVPKPKKDFNPDIFR